MGPCRQTIASTPEPTYTYSYTYFYAYAYAYDFTSLHFTSIQSLASRSAFLYPDFVLQHYQRFTVINSQSPMYS